MTDTHVMGISVKLPVVAERIEWKYMETEDYYIHFAGALIGIVSKVGDMWHISCWMYRDDPAMRKMEHRRYAQAITATAALVKFYTDRIPLVLELSATRRTSNDTSTDTTEV